MIGWIEGGRMHQRLIARKFTHPSIIMTLGNLKLGVPMESILKALSLSHPLEKHKT